MIVGNTELNIILETPKFDEFILVNLTLKQPDMSMQPLLNIISIPTNDTVCMSVLAPQKRSNVELHTGC